MTPLDTRQEHLPSVSEAALSLLVDPSPRVRFQALQLTGRLCDLYPIEFQVCQTVCNGTTSDVLHYLGFVDLHFQMQLKYYLLLSFFSRGIAGNEILLCCWRAAAIFFFLPISYVVFVTSTSMC